jgi:hypothetical protein
MKFSNRQFNEEAQGLLYTRTRTRERVDPPELGFDSVSASQHCCRGA